MKNRYRTIVFVLITIALAGHILAYDPAWSYWKEITITENSGSDLTDYPVRLTISYSLNKMNHDFSDLRFVFIDVDDNEIELAYWIENYFPWWEATVFVNIPSIPASGTVAIKMYYGNPDAISLSSDLTITSTDPEPTYSIGGEQSSVSCGDSICSHGDEDCEDCPGDCLADGMVCCGRDAYDGNCCVDEDCAEGQSCKDHECGVWCGDDIIGGIEVCDNFDFGDETCATVLADDNYHGDLVCGVDCDVIDTSNCVLCGNGAIEGYEQCDGSEMGDFSTCTDLYGDSVSGTLVCTDDCLYGISGCSGCGNDVKEDGEECDGFDFGDETCQTLLGNNLIGYLVCTDTCTIDDTKCYECGDGIVDEYEDCDDGKHCEDGTTSCNFHTECAAIGDGLCKTRDTDICFDDCSIGPRYTYDSNDNLIKMDYHGMTGDTQYSYDADENLILEARVINGAVYVTRHSYESGNFVNLATPEWEFIYQYNADDQLTREEFIVGGTTEIITYDYNEDGLISCINCGADATGEKEEYEYNEDSQVIQYKNDDSITYQYFDDNGRLLGKVDDVGESAEYNYNDEGNLAIIDDYGYFGEDILFDNCGTGDYAYDSNCNILDDGYYLYNYDADGRLVSKEYLDESGDPTGEITSYEYDIKGHLIRKTYPDTSTEEYIYENGFPVRFIDVSGTIYYYLHAGDSSSLLLENEFFEILGDQDADLDIDFNDLLLAIANGEPDIMLLNILYNEVMI